MVEGVTALFLLATCALVYFFEVSKRKRPVPPGPKPLPIVGNLFDLPAERPWLTYRQWAKQYGSDVLFLHLPRQPIIILNSFRATIDLIERRSKLYSDRPHSVMDKLTGWDWNLGLLPYGQRWRDTRRCFHQHFNQGVVRQYQSIQTREVRAFLQRALCFEGEVDVQSVSLTFAAIILDITYGIRVHSFDDELASLSQKAVEACSSKITPGALWVEFFPWLRYLPTWAPGSSARRLGEHFKPVVQATRNIPFEAISRAVADGTATPSVAQKLIRKLNDDFVGASSDQYNVQEQIAKDATGVAYAAAIDTLTAAACWFFVAMSITPEAQAKAQLELDTVLGTGRLPSLDDIESLPYMRAVVLEVMRWQPVSPLAVPHRLMEDDEYEGHFIPAGAIIFPNSWAMLHDPALYPEPLEFKPERFLEDGQLHPEVMDPLNIAFGFGRRICPGRHLARDILTLFIASVLHIFDIEPTKYTSDGKPWAPNAKTDLICGPESVPCRMKPRNAGTILLIDTANA